MKVLVTGAAGFIGSYLTERLLDLGHDVTVFDHCIRGKNLKDDVLEKVTVMEGNVLDSSVLKKAISGCEMVFHFAALVGVDAYASQRVLTMETEEMGLHNVCHLALEEGCRKIAYPSSSAVYGSTSEAVELDETLEVAPVSNYAIAKRFNELYLASQYQEKGLQSVSLRIFNVYGPRQDERLVIPRFVKSALRNDPIVIYGDGHQTRDFIYIDDVVESFIRCSMKVEGCEIVNVATGKEHSVREVAEMIVENTGSKSQIQAKALPQSRSGFEVDRCSGATVKLGKLTGFTPSVSLHEGLQRTCEYIRQIESV